VTTYKINKGCLEFFDENGKKINGSVNYGGYLDLSGTAITALPDNLTVGGYLDLRGTAITALPDNLTVGGSLDLRDTAIKKGEAEKVNRDISGLSLKISADLEIRFNAKGFSITDKILSRIVSKKSGVMKVVIAGKKETSFLVSDGSGNYSHGKTLKEARDGLIYKISSRDTTPYKSWKSSDVRPTADIIKAYRVITGACEGGVRAFIERNGGMPDEMKVSEVFEKTKGEYGSEQFKQFFA
jgi:hypothetical protein